MNGSEQRGRREDHGTWIRAIKLLIGEYLDRFGRCPHDEDERKKFVDNVVAEILVDTEWGFSIRDELHARVRHAIKK